MTHMTPTPGGRRVAVNAVLQAGAEVIGKVATLALTVVAARALSQEAFGAFAYALAFAPLVAVLWSWGLGTLFIQEASASPRDLPRLYGEFILLRAVLAVPAVALFGAVGALLRPDPGAALVLIFVLIAWAINSFREANVAAGIARQRMVGVTTAVVVDRLATAALGIGVLLAGMGVVALGIAFLTGSLAGYLVARVAVRRLGISLDLRAVERKRLFSMLRRSFYIGIDTLVSQFLFRMDALLLSAFKGDAVLAAYSVAYRLLETVLFIAWAVARALFPAMSARGGDGVRRGLAEGIAALAVVYVPFGVVVFMEAGRIIPLLFGPQYGAPSAAAARWLAAAPILFGISYLAGFGLQALERRKEAFVASLVAAVFNIALNLVLIPPLGPSGAAIATSAAYAVESIVSLVILARVVGVPRLGKRMVAPLGGSVIMAIAMVVVQAPVLAEIVFATCIYLAVYYALARRFSPDQIELIRAVMPGSKNSATR